MDLGQAQEVADRNLENVRFPSFDPIVPYKVELETGEPGGAVVAGRYLVRCRITGIGAIGAGLNVGRRTVISATLRAYQEVSIGRQTGVDSQHPVAHGLLDA